MKKSRWMGALGLSFFIILGLALWSCGPEGGLDSAGDQGATGSDQGFDYDASHARGLNTKISAKGLPGTYTYSATAKFRFSCTASPCAFKCNLDNLGWQKCASPKSYNSMVPGDHTFMVKATSAGKTDKTPAMYRWMILVNAWEPISSTNAPSARTGHAALWTGYEMIIWGGWDGANRLNTGAKYTPSTDTWTATSDTNAPVAREAFASVMSGTEMIVWGGYDGSNHLNTGGRYNPSTNEWSVTSTTNAPSARRILCGVWAEGYGMIVWGGLDSGGGRPNTGGIYNPSDNSWTATATTNTPEGRQAFSCAWTGTEMIVWGGWNGATGVNTGARYSPSGNSWTEMSTVNAPSGRTEQASAWTDSFFLAWGGYEFLSSGRVNTGGWYDPYSNTWTSFPTTNAPSARSLETMGWDGFNMIIWGGFNGATYLNTGAKYQWGTQTWTEITTTNAPLARKNATGVWDPIDDQLIIWGGDNTSSYFDSGGRYRP